MVGIFYFFMGINFTPLLFLTYFIVVNKKLTGISLTVHVKFAAGLECFDVQLARKLSPVRYLGRIPKITGRCSGTSEIYNKTQDLINYLNYCNIGNLIFSIRV